MYVTTGGCISSDLRRGWGKKHPRRSIGSPGHNEENIPKKTWGVAGGVDLNKKIHVE